MAIDTALSPTRMACPVAGDVVGVASLASTTSVRNRLTVPTKHQVVSNEQVSVFAVSSTGHGVNSMSDLIESVFSVSPVDDVFWSIVELIAISMPRYESFRTRSVESQSDQNMNLETSLLSVIPVDSDLGVSLITNMGLQDPTFSSGARDRHNISCSAGSVVAKTLDARISVIHDHEYTEGAVA